MNHLPAPRFLTSRQVLELHRISLAEHGGLDGVRDPGAVESASAAARNVWFYGCADFHELAAAYAFHLAECQAFLDGNKRVAAASAVAFLVLNGCADRARDQDIYEAMIAIAAHRLDRAELAAVLRAQFPRAAE